VKPRKSWRPDKLAGITHEPLKVKLVRDMCRAYRRRNGLITLRRDDLIAIGLALERHSGDENPTRRDSTIEQPEYHAEGCH
jgi:hypothetical protein